MHRRIEDPQHMLMRSIARSIENVTLYLQAKVQGALVGQALKLRNFNVSPLVLLHMGLFRLNYFIHQITRLGVVNEEDTMSTSCSLSLLLLFFKFILLVWHISGVFFPAKKEWTKEGKQKRRKEPPGSRMLYCLLKHFGARGLG